MTSLAFEFAAGAMPVRAPPAGSPHILWIDADSGAIEPGLEMLRRHGYEVERAGSASSSYPPPGELVPHAPPALLVRSILEVSAEGASAIVQIPDDSPFVQTGRAPAFVGLEAGAQTAAVLEALGRSEGETGPRIGYVVAIRNARFRTPWEAHLARTLLESHGIDACVMEERFPPLDLQRGQPLALNRLEVHPDDASRALEVLAAVETSGEGEVSVNES